MKRLTFIVCLSLALFASLAIADDFSRDNNVQTQRIPFDARGANTSMLNGWPVSAGKAAAETVYLMGGPALQTGKFQTVGFVADEQGWTGKDNTDMSASWHISDYNCANLDPVTGNVAMWCGEVFAGDCGGGDTVEGYDNNYNIWLDWYSDPVADPLLPTLVTVRANLNSDSEPDYDYLTLRVEKLGVMEVANTAAVFTGYNVFDPLAPMEVKFTVDAADYVGDALDQVHLRWIGFADGGYSDGDCLYPSSGLAQVDNIEVLFGAAGEEVQQTYDTFQPGDPVSWVNVKPPFVGEFHKVWPLLGDSDECTSNVSPQMAFIDDGVVVPGTGGTYCNTWNYGVPGGWGTNSTGGLAGDTYGINNEVWSPVMAWPVGSTASLDGANFLWNVYTHLPIDNGLFYQWGIRTSLDGGLTWPGSWKDNNTVYYGGGLATYGRAGFAVTSKLNSGRNAVQLALGVTEPWIEDYLGNDNTPAPYFDNVTLLAFAFGGPALSVTGAWSLFNDGWPENPEISYSDLTLNSVRLDIGQNIAARATSRNDPGDSVVVTIKAVRTGAVLTGRPTMHVKMKINPLFDGTCRTAIPAGFTQVGDIITGSVEGDTVWTTSIPPTRMANLWKWDLPDTGFFFPGDMLHYYFRAEDTVGGVAGLSHMPGDTTGFAAFPGGQYYDSGRYYELYKVDALPTMTAGPDKAIIQPHVLFWDDSQDRANQDEWFAALDNLGFRQGIDYDIYCENAPSSGQGNGLGGRTNALKMAGYNTMLYTPGNLGSYTICNGDPAGDPGNDIAVVDAWLQQGGKHMFATGDNIIQDLTNSGTNSVTFRDKWFGVAYNNFEIKPLIGGQMAPRVSPITVAGAPVLSKPYIAQGGCDGGINDFDAITAVAPAVRIAQFLSPTGALGVYPYAAAVFNDVTVNTAQVVFMPYDLSYIWNGVPTGGIAVRASILQDVLSFFGNLPGGLAVGVETPGVFTAKNFPNPFNPSTKIEFTLPVKGQVELKIYNVRGELVKTLLNEVRDAKTTHSVTWDGRNSTGQSVSSGVYFYSLKAGSYEKMEKMTLVK
jgi:hypothetical protein